MRYDKILYCIAFFTQQPFFFYGELLKFGIVDVNLSQILPLFKLQFQVINSPYGFLKLEKYFTKGQQENRDFIQYQIRLQAGINFRPFVLKHEIIDLNGSKTMNVDLFCKQTND